MKALALTQFLALLMAGAVFGADSSWTITAPLIPRELLFAEVEKTQALLSPDGAHVGYLERQENHRRLQVVPADLRAKGITVPIAGDVFSWQWTYDGRIVAIADESGVTKLLLCEPANVPPTDISWVPGASYQLVASSPKRPKEIVVHCRAADASKSGLYSVDLAGGEATRIKAPSDFDRWYFDSNLRLRAGRRPTARGAALVRLDTTGTWVPIVEYTDEELMLPGSPNLNVVSVSSDGSDLYLVDAHGSDKSCLKRVNLRTGETSLVYCDSLADVLAVGAIVSPVTGAPQAVVSYFSEMRRGYLDTSFAPDFAELGEIEPGDVSFVNGSGDGNHWLIRYLNGGPARYYVWDRRMRQAQFLFSDVPALDRMPLASRSQFVVAASDGLKLPCTVLLPPGADSNLDGTPDRPLPTILYVHGGPWIGFQRNLWMSNRIFQFLANRGHAVIVAEFRGAMGYGKKFMDAGDRQWGARMQQDLNDIVDSAIARKVTLADRIAIFGWSYGGYATMTALAQTPERFACGVSMYGVADLPSICRTRIANNDFWRTRLGNPYTDSAALAAVSPYRFASEIKRPLLLTHGGRDDRVPAIQTQLMADTLAKLGKPVTFLFYPSEQHDFRSDNNWISFMAVMERFLAAHLGGRYEDYSEAFIDTEARLVTGAKYVDGLADEFRKR